jgi:aryl-alcohol dehydrogenase-like predicted oxidoreductase
MSPQFPATDLPTRRLGDSELEVSAVGLGCNNFGGRLDLDRTGAVLEAALAAGITLFDTADIYGGSGGSERLMGEVLEGRRGEFVLATKFGMEMKGADGVPEVPRGSREYIRWAVDGSLRRLRVDRIDLYQLHQPDEKTPIRETLAALGELVAEGVVTAIGCSNFSAAQLDEAKGASEDEGLPHFVSVQNHYSLLTREIEAEVMPAAERLGSRSSPSSRSKRAFSPASTSAAKRDPRERGWPAPRRGPKRSSTSSRRSRRSPPSAESSRSTSRSPASWRSRWSPR